METDRQSNAVPGEIQGMTIAARWSLTSPGKETVSGLTLLVLRPLGDGWVIVQDASM